MLTWSTSTTSLNPQRQNKAESKVGEEFLKKWDDAVYDGKSIGDPELDREAALWREKFPHIRVVGTSCGEHKVMHPLPVTPQNEMKSAITHSKSADTVRLGAVGGNSNSHSNANKSTLPKIFDARRSLKK